MRFLGIDYGKKRVGLAISDEKGDIAFPYDTLSNNKDLINKIVSVYEKENVNEIVIGESKTLSGKDNPVMRDINIFKDRLSESVDTSIHMEPEYFTTQEAKRFQKKGRQTDASAATFILQRFLEKNNFRRVQEN